ncbi:Zinc finger matrin-type protein 5 [Trichoplax sp. H2]|nr:Zinc finger matrin-type protein 5 [Trichoplax sp. H2]|eukprot:RDD46468.1 Zinc finger matrin-type protein 5 [Trichoplax sp. H2]
MGKRYYCDFCERYITDSVEIRKKHRSSFQHQRLTKLHYDSFRDAAQLLSSQSMKPHSFIENSQNNSPFQSYYGIPDISRHWQGQTSASGAIDQAETQAIVDQWMTNVQIRRSKENSKRGEAKDTSIPVALPPVNDLPPSLKPASFSLTDDASSLHTIEWGK